MREIYTNSRHKYYGIRTAPYNEFMNQEMMLDLMKKDYRGVMLVPYEFKE